MADKKTARQVADATRRAKALELRLAGASWQQTADGAGFASAGAAFNAVKREIDAIPRENAELLVQQELERLDRLQMAHWKNARNGDTFATGTVLKVMDARAKLLGLYDQQRPEDGNLEAIRAALLGFREGLKEVDLGDGTNDSGSHPPQDHEPEAGTVDPGLADS